MKKYRETTAALIPHDYSGPHLQQHLDSMASDGWELHSILPKSGVGDEFVLVWQKHVPVSSKAWTLQR